MKHPDLHIPRPARLPFLVILFTLLLAACSPTAYAQSANGSPNTPQVYGGAPPLQTSTPGAPATGGTVQAADNQKFGKILVNSDGMTLYTFEIDTSNASKCTDSACVADWPPLTINGKPEAGSEVTGQLATISRPDGTQQVSYGGKPLYTFIADQKPGDVTGEGVNEFGGIWHVVIVKGSSG